MSQRHRCQSRKQWLLLPVRSVVLDSEELKLSALPENFFFSTWEKISREQRPRDEKEKLKIEDAKKPRTSQVKHNTVRLLSEQH